ncbi:MAG: hypothetical protein ACK4NW_08935 [Roseinatronobacter sp.]
MGIHVPTSHETKLTSAKLRAFLHAGSMKPGRPEILRHPPEIIAKALALLTSDDAARCLALMPAAAQIAVVSYLDANTHMRLVQDCDDWLPVVPILRKRHKARQNGWRMTPARHA